VIGHYHRYLRVVDGERDLIALPPWRDRGGYALAATRGGMAVVEANR